MVPNPHRRAIALSGSRVEISSWAAVSVRTARTCLAGVVPRWVWNSRVRCRRLTLAILVGSVCTGSLVLGAAGLLTGRRATTHWAALPMLAAFGAEPVTRRWVRDGPVLTAAGVAAGIDMALHLVGELAGEEASRQVQLAIEYDPQSPFGPIDWETTDRTLVEAWIPRRPRPS